MSTDVRTLTGQTRPAGAETAPASTGGQTAPAGSPLQNPQTLLQESIKYRRRAQEAERRAEAQEAEIQDLRQARDDRTASLEEELIAARSEADALRGRLDGTERDRGLERELLRAGCIDPEAALAVARERLGAGPVPDDLAAFTRGLLDEKPHLRGDLPGGSARTAAALPPPTAAARPAGAAAPQRAALRLADQARQTGNPRDLMAYMRARRPGA